MQEMTSAKSSMSQKDMAGCSMHMNKAMKMGMMKSKKIACGDSSSRRFW